MLAAFRADPAGHPLKTPSGRIEIYSERIASFGYDDCPGHATWLEPIEWLGRKTAERYPLHMLSDQPPTNCTASSTTEPAFPRDQGQRPSADHAAPRRCRRARHRPTATRLRVFNDRGACLATVVLDDGMLAGVVRLSTGAWFDVESADGRIGLENHGNPNVLTSDLASSSLSQATAAQTCLVEVERYEGSAAPVAAFSTPALVRLGG